MTIEKECLVQCKYVMWRCDGLCTNQYGIGMVYTSHPTTMKFAYMPNHIKADKRPQSRKEWWGKKFRAWGSLTQGIHPLLKSLLEQSAKKHWFWSFNNIKYILPMNELLCLNKCDTKCAAWPQSSSWHNMATPRLIQCSGGSLVGNVTEITKLVEWPVVERVPFLSLVL